MSKSAPLATIRDWLTDGVGAIYLNVTHRNQKRVQALEKIEKDYYAGRAWLVASTLYSFPLIDSCM